LSLSLNATIAQVNLDDTIVAIATPPGRGGIGVVRIAGPRARDFADPMLRLKQELEPGRAVFGELIEPCGSDTHVRLFPAGTNSAEPCDSPPPAETTSSVVSRRRVSDPHQQRIDEVVVTYFAKPHSYTTDDIIEMAASISPRPKPSAI